jgi:hypothetical protein
MVRICELETAFMLSVDSKLVRESLARADSSRDDSFKRSGSARVLDPDSAAR